MKKMFTIRMFIFLSVLFIATTTFAKYKFDYGEPCSSSHCNCIMTFKRIIPNGCGDTSKVLWKCECDCNSDDKVDYTETGWACVY